MPRHQARQKSPEIKIAGILTTIKRIITGSGKPMIFATLEDQTGRVEIVVFNDMLEKNLGIWEENKLIKVKGKISNKDGENKIICEQTEELVASLEKYKSLTISLPNQLKQTQVDEIKKHSGAVARNHSGNYQNKRH
jgi:DNA polymerase III alpha subunit